MIISTMVSVFIIVFGGLNKKMEQGTRVATIIVGVLLFVIGLLFW